MTYGQRFQVQDEQQLLETIVSDVRASNKQKASFMIHFPLTYENNVPGEQSFATENFEIWGPFSSYFTNVFGQAAHQLRNDVGIEFFNMVDDHTYTQTDSQKRAKKNTFKHASGPNGQMAKPIQDMIKTYNFGVENFVRQNHNKNGREDCLYISENILRASDLNIDNACAREYTTFVNDPELFDKKTSHLVSAIPDQCIGNVCEGVLDTVEGLSASHVLVRTPFEIIGLLNNGSELYQDHIANGSGGIWYRQDK